MMYVAVYPIALSVRSTNVYEERSLGLFNEDDELEMNDEEKGAHAVANMSDGSTSSSWLESVVLAHEQCATTAGLRHLVAWLCSLACLHHRGGSQRSHTESCGAKDLAWDAE